MLILFFFLGLAVGSFLNVCIYRIPRKISVVRPPSHCPSCQAGVAAWDNIPVLSFVLLRGRCRHCGSPIHWRYPLVEVIGGGLFLACYVKFGLSFDLFLCYAFACAMVVVAFIDFEHWIIPDEITIPLLIVGVTGSFFTGLGWLSSALGVVAGGGSLLVVALLYLAIRKQDGMGGGDFKLAAMMGAFLGWKGILLTIFLASLGGSLVGIPLSLALQRNLKKPVPFGVFLAAAGLFALFFGDAVIRWYLSIPGLRQ